MNDVLVRCTCLRRLDPNDDEAEEVVCNEPFQRKSPEGHWYWCLYCDAHWSECGNKGSQNYLDCPSEPPPPCRTEPLRDEL